MAGWDFQKETQNSVCVFHEKLLLTEDFLKLGHAIHSCGIEFGKSFPSILSFSMDKSHSSNAEVSVMRIGSPLEIKYHNPDSRNMKADAPLPCFVPFGVPLIGT